jgi:hypothetical protein
MSNVKKVVLPAESLIPSALDEYGNINTSVVSNRKSSSSGSGTTTQKKPRKNSRKTKDILENAIGSKTTQTIDPITLRLAALEFKKNLLSGAGGVITTSSSQ